MRFVISINRKLDLQFYFADRCDLYIVSVLWISLEYVFT